MHIRARLIRTRVALGKNGFMQRSGHISIDFNLRYLTIKQVKFEKEARFRGSSLLLTL
jgi:hypothetical protein